MFVDIHLIITEPMHVLLSVNFCCKRPNYNF